MARTQLCQDVRLVLESAGSEYDYVAWTRRGYGKLQLWALGMPVLVSTVRKHTKYAYIYLTVGIRGRGIQV